MLACHDMQDLSQSKYISLETYRKDGRAVATPVWFVDAGGGLLYVYSEANAGKVNRLRNNSAVRIAVCAFRGNRLGDWIPATGRVLSESANADVIEQANVLLDQKYGLIRIAGGFFSKLFGRKRDFIAIQLA